MFQDIEKLDPLGMPALRSSAPPLYSSLQTSWIREMATYQLITWWSERPRYFFIWHTNLSKTFVLFGVFSDLFFPRKSLVHLVSFLQQWDWHCLSQKLLLICDDVNTVVFRIRSYTGKAKYSINSSQLVINHHILSRWVAFLVGSSPLNKSVLDYYSGFFTLYSTKMKCRFHALPREELP